MRARLVALIVLLAASLAVPAPAAAQVLPEYLYEFEMVVPLGQVQAAVSQVASVEILFRDSSLDAPAGLQPDEPTGAAAFPHRTTFALRADSEDPQGWVIQPIPSISTFSGEEETVVLRVIPGVTAINPNFVVNITATTLTDGGRFVHYAKVSFFSEGIQGLAVRAGRSLDLDARQIGQTSIIVTNVALQPRTVETMVIDNPCGLLVAPPAQFTLRERETRELQFSVQGPEGRFWYNSQDCSLLVGAHAVGSGGEPRTTSVGVTVNGFYVDPTWVFWAAVVALVAVLLFLFVKRRKDRIEEEILGKPQKPWTIPIEKVYLEHLRRKDERAWYVVRHHLMEEEHRSALLWYQHYKHATRASRKKERVILREEQSYERWQRHWERRLAKPLAQADRFEAKLQRRLDRRSRQLHREATKKWRRLTAKLQAHHQAAAAKAEAAWQKQAAKAQKKGRPVPPRPAVAAPEDPPRPEPVPIPLAEHRWAKKAARFRRRRERELGNLEVKHEKADARRRRHVVRRMQRLARRLDDPDFVQEHPMLGEAGGAR